MCILCPTFWGGQAPSVELGGGQWLPPLAPSVPTPLKSIILGHSVGGILALACTVVHL